VLESTKTARKPPAAVVLDEIAAAGYAGTELGEWGFLPTDPQELFAETAARGLHVVGAFVPVALARGGTIEEALGRAVRIGRLLAAVTAPNEAPILVLSDDNATASNRTKRAGRVRSEDGLNQREWDAFAARAAAIAAEVRDATGLRTAFHHHCAGYVETPAEIDALMSRTSPSLLGLCLDTGHLAFGGGDPLTVIPKYGERIWHVHFKDYDPAVAHQARSEQWDYHTAVRHGIFCELGRGEVPFTRVRDALSAFGYGGWIVVEQDVLPGLGTPAASATRNREFLRRLGL
jgi:inosose dehydratase